MLTEPQSAVAREVDKAFFILTATSFLLLAGITIAMVYFIIRYRRSKTPTVSQIHGNTPLEITWIILPVILVTWLFFVGYTGFSMMRTPPEGGLVVEVIGRQWSWTFNYPDERISSTEMVVPVDTPIKVHLTAPPEDVLHSFYIPDFRVKEDVVPGRDTWLWFQAEREGVFNIFCAEYCGKDHSDMISLLRVVSIEEYTEWTYGTQLKRFKPLNYDGFSNPDDPVFGPGDLAIDTKALFDTFCASCHGTRGDGSGLPGLARDFRSADAWKLGTSVAGIWRTLHLGIPTTQMRAYPNLSPWEKVALAHYVRRFLEQPPPPDTEAEYDALIKEYALDKVQAPARSIPIEKAIDLVLEEAQTDQATPSS